jgi:NAD-dependent deacetylase
MGRDARSGRESVVERIRKAGAITVLSGAGISTESGIPDFRGPQGVWTKDPAAAAMSTIEAYVSDPQVRRRSWQARLAHPTWSARPNAGHEALVELERAGRLRAIVTQNIDGLHQSAGSDPGLVIEVHGTIHQVECLTCEARTRMREVLDRVEAGEADPPCLACGGIQKSATISFGQALKPAVFSAAVRAACECDLFLVLGSSLTVNPVAGLCLAAIEHGATLVILNAQETPYDEVADAVLREPIGSVLPRLVADALAG